MKNSDKNLNLAGRLSSAIVTLLIFVSAFAIQFVITFMYLLTKISAVFLAAFNEAASTEEMQFLVIQNIGSLLSEIPDYDLVIFLIYLVSAIIFATLYYLLVYRNITLRSLTAKSRRLRLPTVFFIIICGIFMQIYISIAINNILPFFEKTMNNYIELMDSLTGNNSVFSIIAVTLLAPIAEELLFRGLIQKRLGQIMPAAAAIIIQALLFGIYHLNIVQGIYAFLIGLAAGLLVHSCKTVNSSILLHIAINSASYLVTYALPIQVIYTPALASIVFAFTFMISTVLIIYMTSRRSTEPQLLHAEAPEHNSLY